MGGVGGGTLPERLAFLKPFVSLETGFVVFCKNPQNAPLPYHRGVNPSDGARDEGSDDFFRAYFARKKKPLST